MKSFVWGVLINTAVLVIIALWIPYGGLSMQPVTWQSTPVLLVIGLIFRFIYHVARPLLKFLATPINLLTLGLAGILLNMIALYGFVFILQALNLGVTVTLGSIEQTFVLSIIVSILTLVLKKIL